MIRTALALPAAAGLVLALAAPAAAAPPTLTTVDSAFGTLQSGSTAVLVDGFSAPDVLVGVVEVFAGSVECVQPDPEDLQFSSQGTAGAALTGTAQLDCYDLTADRAVTGTVTGDLTWTPSGPVSVRRSASPQQRCTSTRSTVPALLTGTVTVVLDGETVVLQASPDRPAELASQTDRCVSVGS